MLDTNRLRIFCAVADEGSFTAAAARLHYTQSAVSQQVAILERELGVVLVERGSRGIVLTPPGTVLAHRGHVVLASIAGLEQEVHHAAEGPAQIRLGVFATAGAHLLPWVVRRHRELLTDVELLVSSCRPDELATQLEDGTITVGLGWDYDVLPRRLDGLAVHHLLSDTMCALLPSGHPLADEPDRPLRLAELAAQQWVVRIHRGANADAFATMCHMVGFEPEVVFSTEDYSALTGLVAAGVGVAVAPRLALVALRPDVVARELVGPAFARRIYAALLPGAERDPVVAQLLSVLQEVAASDLEATEGGVPDRR